jgi:hypothetical protein
MVARNLVVAAVLAVAVRPEADIMDFPRDDQRQTDSRAQRG